MSRNNEDYSSVITNGGILSKYAYSSTKIIGSLMPFSFENLLKNVKEIL